MNKEKTIVFADLAVIVASFVMDEVIGFTLLITNHMQLFGTILIFVGTLSVWGTFSLCYIVKEKTKKDMLQEK